MVFLPQDLTAAEDVEQAARVQSLIVKPFISLLSVVVIFWQESNKENREETVLGCCDSCWLAHFM